MNDLTAETDQALAAVRDFARPTRAYFDALLEQGFTEPQALELTGSYVQGIIARGGTA